MTTTTTTARVSANQPHPSTLQAVARGVLLLIGGLVVILVVEPVGPKKLYWMPLIIGLTYLVTSMEPRSWRSPPSPSAPDVSARMVVRSASSEGSRRGPRPLLSTHCGSPSPFTRG